ncbi:MAG: hypothetical protein ABF932_00650 [Gluconobacter potus]|uniref:hypothetical protein n=1 Tax=Gluconobacter TaxID=441 RepID=UPI0039E87218
MTVEDVYRSENILVKKIGAFSKDNLVISFDSYTDRPHLDRPGFGEHFFQKNSIDCIHVLSRTNTWYQYPEMGNVIDEIRKISQNYDRIFTYGASMGGYAAIRFGGKLDATAIAIAPQYSVDPKIMPEERRWLESVNLTYSQERRRPIEPLKCTIIFYDPFDALDRRHVKRISQDTSVTEAAIPYAGHMAGVYLAEVGMLGKGILEIINSDFDAVSFSHLARKRRRESAKYYEVLSALARCRHPEWALSLARKAAEICPSDAGPAHNLAQYHKERSEYAEAEFWEQKATELDPSNLLYQKCLAIILLEKKETIKCRTILENLMKAVPEEADYFHLMALSFRAEGRLSEALSLEEQAVARNPTRRLYQKDLASLRKELNNKIKNHRDGSEFIKKSSKPENNNSKHANFFMKMLMNAFNKT